MKKLILILVSLACFFYNSQGQSEDWLSTIKVLESDDQKHIKLEWTAETNATYQVSRKLINEKEWTILANNLDGNTYTDQNSALATAYEYRVVREGTDLRLAHIYAGIKVPATTDRGRLLLLVETEINLALSDKVKRWVSDAEGDGWVVIQKSVSASAPPQEVKSIIRAEYLSGGLTSVFLLGHIPVPYSGELWPDGHTNNHAGAWSADAYYADLNEPWTDYLVETSGQPARTNNVPIDGKLDKSSVTEAELEVGRVDFNSLPAFNESEIELTEKYLDKNHAFKHQKFIPQNKAIYIDKFNRDFDITPKLSFPGIVGAENTIEAEYRESLLKDSYLWSYGAGAGSYASASGVVTTAQLAQDSLQSVFNILFGSYFGDYGSNNNLLRAALGSGTILTSCWGNRPFWVLFHMGLGTHIGLQTKLTLNDGDDLYYGNSINGWNSHVGLMGDPTLRAHMVLPVENLTADATGQTIIIEWTHASTNPANFILYAKTESQDKYAIIDTIVSDLSYTYEENTRCGNIRYMLRAEILQATPSGSYYNQSVGQFTELSLQSNDNDGDGYCIEEDCNDMDATINASAVEIPGNGIDDNCNDYVDELDEDNDGYHSFIDCDDLNALINPAALEILNNGIDENCDSEDQLTEVCLFDFPAGIDEQTYISTFASCSNLPIKNTAEGILPNTSFATLFPAQGVGFNINFCDGYDEAEWQALINIYYFSDFNTVPKVGALIKSEYGCSIDFIFEQQGFYLGFIVEIKDATSCAIPSSMVPNGLLEINCIPLDEDNDGFSFEDDCDDNNPSINPDQTEVPYNGIDDDCNTATLDDDLDQDGFLLADDCDDSNFAIHPDATEFCNDLDDNCNGIVDEGLAVITYYVDADKDGYGDKTMPVDACSQPAETVINSADCDDTDPNINPDAIDIPNNGIDEDCDGEDLISAIQKLSNATINIFPNPVVDHVNIEIKGHLDFVATLFDLKGQRLLSGSNTKQLSVTSLASGSYLLEIRDVRTGQKVVEKIVVGR